MRIYLMIIISLIGWVSPLQAQEYLKTPVILIQSTGLDGIEEQATGLLVGRQGNTLYAITVAHAIVSQQIVITLRNNQSLTGHLVNKSDTRDVAVVRFEAPAGYQPPNSFALTKQSMTPGMSVKVVGHPYGNRWNVNYSNNLNETIFDFDNNLFTLSANNINPGNSGGPVLDSQNEWMGIVKSVDAVKAICIKTPILLQMMNAWEVPINLLIGVAPADNISSNSIEDIQYRQFLQEANTAFQNGRWEQAARAYREADRLKPSQELKNNIQKCEEEQQKDEQYDKALRQGLNASDLPTALKYYRQAQTYRDTENIRQLISQTQTRLKDITPNISQPPSGSNSTAHKDYTDPLIGDMVYVEGGSFTMGQNDPNLGCTGCSKDEQPPHTVKVPSFYIGRYEITQAQWKKIMGNNPSSFKDCDECPVESISWDDSKDFVKKLNQKSNYTYRLLTEAEWEYAAKGGKNKNTYLYAGSNNADDVAWYDDNSGSKTHPVGGKKANSLGIYDMSGNVWEWCEDWYHDSYKNAPSDGSAWLSPTGSSRVLRGGSWFGSASSVRVAFRDRITPDYRNRRYGVRLARTP